MLTAKQHSLLMFIHERLEATGISPSFEEMKEALDLKSKSGVHRLIGALEERGFLRRLANRARALEVVKMPDGGSARGLAKDEAVNNKVVTLSDHRPAAPKSLPVAANDVIEIPLHGRAFRLRPWKARPRFRCQWHCLAPANIMRWKCPETRWSKQAFLMGTMR